LYDRHFGFEYPCCRNGVLILGENGNFDHLVLLSIDIAKACNMIVPISSYDEKNVIVQISFYEEKKM